jgi:DNA polymerase elongation subunit (family B)
LQFGRRKTDIYSIDQSHIVDKWSQGRVYIDHRDYSQNDIVAFIELSNFSCLPLRMILKYSIGHLIASRNLYELIFRGHVISDNYNERTHEHIRTLEEIVDRDKAGMIFSPQVGLHENVVVLDYNDEFANIIINNNISYETLTQQRQNGDSSLYDSTSINFVASPLGSHQPGLKDEFL